MATKQFGSEILTSGDVNTYLANSGLVYVTTTALSGTTTDVANCFNSSYDAYRVVIWNLDLSTTTTRALGIRFSNGGTPTAAGYDWWSSYVYAGGGGNEGASSTNMWQITQYSGDTPPAGGFSLDIYNPYGASHTTGIHHAFAYQSGAGGFVNRIGGGVLRDNTSYTGMTVVASGDSMSGNITVYGYRRG
jgi:hypothetical protein